MAFLHLGIVAFSFFLGSHLHNLAFIEKNYIHTTFLQVLLAASLFHIFLTLPPFHSKAINKLAGAVLGIYLIHDNNLMRPFYGIIFFLTLIFCTRIGM